jgi:cbb3-type cytochrome oxidase subunit 3
MYSCIHNAGFEFICAQSPYNMRGLLIGVFYSVQDLFSLASFLLRFTFSSKDVYSYPFLGKTGRTCAFWFFLVAIGVSVLGLAFYWVVAWKYKRRKRDDVFNEVTLIEEYFTSCVVNNI